jgi:hypothetical protein
MPLSQSATAKCRSNIYCTGSSNTPIACCKMRLHPSGVAFVGCLSFLHSNCRLLPHLAGPPPSPRPAQPPSDLPRTSTGATAPGMHHAVAASRTHTASLPRVANSGRRGAWSPGRTWRRPSVPAQIRSAVACIKFNLPQRMARSNVSDGEGNSTFLPPHPSPPSTDDPCRWWRNGFATCCPGRRLPRREPRRGHFYSTTTSSA